MKKLWNAEDVSGDWKNRAGLSLIFLASLCALAYLYNLWPNQAPASQASLSDLAFAECFNNTGSLFDYWCRNAGLPYGNPSTFGLPVQALMSWILKYPGISSLTSLRTTYLIFLAISLFGAIRFFSRFTHPKWIAIFCSVIFLWSPIVVFEGSYGPLRVGFSLLPAYLAVHLSIIDCAEASDRSTIRIVGFLALLAFANLFSIFCDGYSFVMTQFCAGALWLSWAISNGQKRWKYLLLVMPAILVTQVLAVFLYRAYLPITSLNVMPLDFFRGQGVDAYFLAVPSSHLWLADITGIHHHVNPTQAYSDGPSTTLVFVGYVGLACLAASTFFAKDLIARGRLVYKAIIIAGLAALVLSLGPDLKFHTIRPTPAANISFDTYLMPPSKDILSLHTAWIYQHVPGVRFMRALYRWQLVFRLSLIVGVAVVLSWLFNQKRKYTAITICIFIMLETFPAPTVLARGGEKNFHTISSLNASALAELKKSVPRATKTVFLQLHPNPGRNEFLASYLCAAANLKCFNVGGDKGNELSARQWPSEIYEIINGISVNENVQDVLNSNLADIVVVPNFDLRQQAYFWPPHDFPRSEVTLEASRLTDNSLTLEEGKYFTFIRRKSPTAVAQKVLPETKSPINKGEIATIKSWGPATLHITSEEQTYLWVLVNKIPRDDLSLEIDGKKIPTYKKMTEKVLAGVIRGGVEGRYLKAGSVHQIYLIDRATGTRQFVGAVKAE